MASNYLAKIINREENRILSETILAIMEKIAKESDQIKYLKPFFKNGVDCYCQSFELFNAVISMSNKVLKMRKFPNEYRYFEIFHKDFFINAALIKVRFEEFLKSCGEFSEKMNEFSHKLIKRTENLTRNFSEKIELIWPTKTEKFEQKWFIICSVNSDLVDQVRSSKFAKWNLKLNLASEVR